MTTSSYRNMPLADVPVWEQCERCWHPKINLFNLKHAELCDYFHFRNVEAPQLGYSAINQLGDTYYLKILFDLHCVPYRAFHISGIAGHYWDIFLPGNVSDMIDMYNSKGGYAGMSLEEFIVTIVLPEVT